MNTHGWNIAGRITSGLMLAAIMSGCQTARNESAPHPFSRMFDGYDYSAARDVHAERAGKPVSHRESAGTTGNALGNADLIRLAQAGTAPVMIVAEVQTHGGRFDISDDAIRELESEGVHGDVIASIKRIAAYSPAAAVEQDADGIIHAITIPPQNLTTETRSNPRR